MTRILEYVIDSKASGLTVQELSLIHISEPTRH